MEKNKKRKISRNLMFDLFVPFVMLFISLLLIFFVYLPIINQVKEYKTEKEEYHKKYVELKAKKTLITEKNPKELSYTLTQLTKMVPDYINIGDLGKFINKIASERGVSVKSLDLLQAQIAVDDKDITALNTKLNVKVIRGPFKLTGTKEDILNFLDFLVTGPYATEFDAVKITTSDNFYWNVSFTAVHYYMPRVRDIDPEAPVLRPNWEKVKEVLQYKGNGQNLETANSSTTPTPTESVTPTENPTTTTNQ